MIAAFFFSQCCIDYVFRCYFRLVFCWETRPTVGFSRVAERQRSNVGWNPLLARLLDSEGEDAHFKLIEMRGNVIAPRNGERTESPFQLPAAPPLSWCVCWRIVPLMDKVLFISGTNTMDKIRFVEQ
jgi:hypothetical protein